MQITVGIQSKCLTLLTKLNVMFIKLHGNYFEALLLQKVMIDRKIRYIPNNKQIKKCNL